jgi:peptidoglycan L-alanyl-D-glutamate endopeptidase CwlK
MPQYSAVSLNRLRTADQRLQNVFNEAIKTRDISIICGHRTQEEQHDAFIRGLSTKEWPKSKHNTYPSLAVDFAPYFPVVKIDWTDVPAFSLLAGYLIRIGEEQGVKLRWGGDWSGEGRTKDERFEDLDHIEIVEVTS